MLKCNDKKQTLDGGLIEEKLQMNNRSVFDTAHHASTGIDISHWNTCRHYVRTQVQMMLLKMCNKPCRKVQSDHDSSDEYEMQAAQLKSSRVTVYCWMHYELKTRPLTTAELAKTLNAGIPFSAFASFALSSGHSIRRSFIRNYHHIVMTNVPCLLWPRKDVLSYSIPLH